MKENENIIVSIVCTAYNHEPYIRKTLDSFVNQKTSFRFEVIVHDDASTDGTTDIVKEYAERYPDIIVPIIQVENQYSQGKIIALDYIFPRVRGRFIAPCEGDDYWPDNYKLQKQYDYLINHSECSAVCGVTRYFDDNNIECMEASPYKEFVNAYSSEGEFLNNPGALIGTNTLMYRKDIIYDPNYIKAKRDCPKVGDILMMLRLYEEGKIFIMDEYFQMHRIQTREHASNYNSIYDWKAKFLHCTEVVNAVRYNFQKEHDLHEWYDSKVVPFYINACKTKNKKEFYQIYNSVCEEYKRNIVGLLLKYMPSRIIRKIKRCFMTHG